MGQGCAVCLGLKSGDTLEHLKFLEELGNWSRSERNKLLKLYLLMSHLRQVLALIGSFNDLNNDKAEFVHKFVGKETGFLDLKKMKKAIIILVFLIILQHELRLVLNLFHVQLHNIFRSSGQKTFFFSPFLLNSPTFLYWISLTLRLFQGIEMSSCISL